MGVVVNYPTYDPGWFQPGWQQSFNISLNILVGPCGRPIMKDRRGDYIPNMYITQFKAEDDRRADARLTDVFMTVVSPPDEHGFCSFGEILSNKKGLAKRARKVLAQIDPRHVRTYGDNFIHVSEIDYFVGKPCTTLEEAPLAECPGFVRLIAENVSALIQDGDTIQVGIGGAINHIVRLGVFNNKHDLGIHSGVLAPGMATLVREGIFTGKNKTIHRGKVVTSNCGALSKEELNYVDGNPIFELYDLEYIHNIRVISAHDNFVAINSVLYVDLFGQITSESWGPTVLSGAGGVPAFTIGAMMSRGGRSIMLVPSTRNEGRISSLQPTFPPGTQVTVPRTFADYIVTEYGIAGLLGKSQRQRAEELIAIAHPDFRPQLRKEAQKLFYP